MPDGPSYSLAPSSPSQANLGAAGMFCTPFMLLATLCVDMPTMSGCRSYRALCGNSSKVQQCSSSRGIPK